jgi:protein-serine/threonine kinase
MSETERHIGIVLEYASGGELFDYILNHRYLKDHAARRLFAQLISGVGYLHKKGIVHRDLKLENLLLDRNRNIIITDFGFANTFDPADELTEEEELNLSDRDFVKRSGLDKTKDNGMRRGDLMQTSCGSPCYAAPELVVSDSLYTGRKVDVWSCGVILVRKILHVNSLKANISFQYAMLAGYLPFDDDPDNPEGDNINLLYKYIVNTPLTFPEYVTPHARDLLRRILVPSPRKRADLFEVARHSWLSEYAHVVELITSTTTTSSEIQNTTVPSVEVETGALARSASVREPTKAKATTTTAVGDLARKQGKVDTDEATPSKQQRENKRRTVQVEYVPPTTQTQRGAEQADAHSSSRGKTKAGSSSQAPVDAHSSPHDKPLPKDPPVAKESYTGSPRDQRKPPSAHRRDGAPPRGHQTRATSDYPYMTTASGASVSRPATGGSMQSSASRGLGPSSRPYGQPLPPTVAGTNAQGSIQQPKSSKNYVISNPIPQETPDVGFGRPSINMPPKFAEVSGFNDNQPPKRSGEGKGHRRSNTLGEIGGKIFGRSGSIFGGRKKRADQGEKPSKKYPPISMSNTMPGESRTSMDSRTSRRSFSLGLGKKRSGSIAGSQMSYDRPANPRRFSLMKAMGLSKDPTTPPPDVSQPDLPIQDPPDVDSYGRYTNPPQSRGNVGPQHTDEIYEQPQDQQSGPAPQTVYGQTSAHRRYPSASQASAIPSYLQQGAVLNSESESSIDRPQRRPPNSAPYQTGYDSDQYDSRRRGSQQGARVLQKNKRFVDAYDEEEYGRPRDHAGSTGAAKRVMDFFRRRGRARGGEA